MAAPKPTTDRDCDADSDSEPHPCNLPKEPSTLLVGTGFSPCHAARVRHGDGARAHSATCESSLGCPKADDRSRLRHRQRQRSLSAHHPHIQILTDTLLCGRSGSAHSAVLVGAAPNCRIPVLPGRAGGDNEFFCASPPIFPPQHSSRHEPQPVQLSGFL